ncbi:tetratricopeptide repeat protein [Sphaerisporangium sp. TRM90804]|uniref:tetratricopeptide repeat protein n=1 Tax=Sphaerisporangium sp. TRM90804 TaxID=3031113 RepID=UPI002448FE91|nr:tetratricopeptide repeat protein [Sphaerisporangium sp. TRM90804]MDH2426453.1 tetratricopeptide repeat protein [Sphaerisporangium sp. TRM90804]
MRRPSSIVVVLVTTALAAVVNLVTGTLEVQQSWWPPMLWVLAGMLIVGAVLIELRERRSQASQVGELRRVADWVARRVGEQWGDEAALRRLQDPVPLQVRWCSTRRPVAADRALVLDGPAEASWELLPLRGHAEEIVQAFLDLPHRRLVVLGEPGAGKSVLAILLTLGLLEHRQSLPAEQRVSAPVPTLVPIASWNPAAEPLRTFLARRLGEDYPRLSQHGDDEPTLAGALIAERYLLPILDGLDELPEQLRPQALSELNAYIGTGRGLVVTCRSREYQQAIVDAGTELARAAVVELQPVTAEQAIKFLSPAGAQARWQQLFEHLHAHPEDTLAAVLSTPLMVALARDAYTNPDANPGELVTLTDTSAVEAALIDGFISNAYKSDRPVTQGGLPHRYAPRQARWLACLAFQLNHKGRVDWWWWELSPDLVRPRIAKAASVVTLILTAAGAGLTMGLPATAAAALLVAVNTLDLWRPLWPESYPPSYRSTSRRRLQLLRIAFTATGPILAGLALSAPLFGLITALSAVALLVWPALPQTSRRGLGGWTFDRRLARYRVGPRATLRANHREATRTAIQYAAAGALIGGLAIAFIPDALDARVAVLVTALVSGANAGLAAGWRTWIRYRLTHLSLVARGLLPWRLWRFLEDAHLRGVLRQAGTGWQFRHLLVQTHLAAATRADYLRARADADDWKAAEYLVDLLVGQGRVDEAITVLYPHVRRWMATMRLVELLVRQERVEEAITVLRPRADNGDEAAIEWLAELLVSQGRVEEAITVLRPHAEAGDEEAAEQLVDLLADQGRVDELRDRADGGDWQAAERLVGVLAKQGRGGEALTLLRSHADAGHAWAAERLADLLVRQGRVDEAIALLRPHADARDSWLGNGQLVKLLVEQGRVDELRHRADAGDREAARRLVDLLVEQGRIDELRHRAQAGDRVAARRLANLLADQGRVDELRARAQAGDREAAGRLVDLLVEQGRIDEVIRLLHPRADAGDRVAASRLADLLAGQGRVEEAITLLRPLADAKRQGQEAAEQLAELLAGQGRVEEAITLLRPHADAKRQTATERLADLLADQGRVDELRARAEDGDWLAARRLADLLADQGRVDELRARAEDGDWLAAGRLADLLADQGRVEEAITLLRPHADDRGAWAQEQLAVLLIQQGRVDELRSRAAAGDWSATRLLADLLTRQGQVEEAITLLRPFAHIGSESTTGRLADLLARQGRVEEAITLLHPWAAIPLRDEAWARERLTNLRAANRTDE